MTIEEKHLIDRFHAGHFDGMVGNMFETTGGSLVWTEIKEGKININGINSTIFLKHAKSRLTFAWPSAIKLC